MKEAGEVCTIEYRERRKEGEGKNDFQIKSSEMKNSSVFETRLTIDTLLFSPLGFRLVGRCLCLRELCLTKRVFGEQFGE